MRRISCKIERQQIIQNFQQENWKEVACGHLAKEKAKWGLEISRKRVVLVRYFG